MTITTLIITEIELHGEQEGQLAAADVLDAGSRPNSVSAL